MHDMTKHLGLLGAVSQVTWPPGVSHMPSVCFVTFSGPRAMFVYFILRCQVLVVARWVFSCGMQTLSCSTWHLIP